MNPESPIVRRISHWRRFFRVMTSGRIAGNSIRVSLVVGTMLNLINQGEYLVSGEGVMVGHMLLNYLVPYGVASYSGARAVPMREAADEASRRDDQGTAGD